jgi:hypothetical protein
MIGNAFSAAVIRFTFDPAGNGLSGEGFSGIGFRNIVCLAGTNQKGY